MNFSGITLGEFFSDGESVPLTKEQRELLDKWAGLSDVQKELISGVIENMK